MRAVVEEQDTKYNQPVSGRQGYVVRALVAAVSHAVRLIGGVDWMAGGYTYLQSAEGPKLEESSVQVLAGVVDLTIPPEDLADLATLIRDQLGSIKLLEQIDVSGLQPITTFDPRWHD